MATRSRLSESIHLQVPADGRYVAPLRAVAAGMGAVQDFTIDAIDDIRLAVDEACAFLLRTSPGATRLTLDMEPDGDGVDITVGVHTNGANELPAETDGWLIWQILGALGDNVRLETGSDGPAIRFSKRRT